MKNKLALFAALAALIVVMGCGSGSSVTQTENKPENKATPKAEETKKAADKVTDPSGTYRVKGSIPGGSDYEGELAIQKRGDVFQLSWTVGKDSYDGVGVMIGDTLAGAYTTGENGTGCGVVIYDTNDDNLTGKWGAWGVNEAGSETATPQGELKGDVGTFNVKGKNPNGTEYAGTMTITKNGSEVMDVVWNTGSTFSGSAIRHNNRLIAGSGSKQCGFVAYTVTADGLNGRWGVPGSKTLGTENGTKK